MALGDGIRRNIAAVTPAERTLLRDAFVALSDNPAFRYPDGVSFWDKQNEIHQATHVHAFFPARGIAFLPWHRELANRLEAQLRSVDARLSLHYWDWTTNPRNTGGVNLFTPDFMGSPSGEAGPPFQNFETTGQPAPSPADPAHPKIWRAVPTGPSPAPTDLSIVTAGDTAPLGQQYRQFRQNLEQAHNDMHVWLGGTVGGDPHFAFHDPFVFLLHSNVDRLLALWQTMRASRLDPTQVYGDEGNSDIDPTIPVYDPGILTPLDPWAGNPTNNPQVTRIRPWRAPENEHLLPENQKNSRHITVVTPPCYDTNRPVVQLLTPALHFTHIPAGQAASRAVVVRSISCAAAHVTVTAGPILLTGPPATAFTVSSALPVAFGGTGGAAEGRIWVTSHGTAPGDIATATITVHCVETNEDFVIPISMDTVTRQTLAAALVLDRSGSMSLPSGLPGRQRMDILHTAAPAFVDLLRDDDAVGVVQFDHESNILAPVTAAGDIGDPNSGRNTAKTAIGGLADRGGATSIGAGLQQASTALAGVPAFGPRRATVVFTDGYENTAPYIADVAAATISDRVFAIGLGTPDQLDPNALRRLCDNRDGFLMLTGTIASNDPFRLTKYFLQVLAGCTNAEIVTDPESAVLPGQKHRIPFILSDAETSADVILLSPGAERISFSLETPDGDPIDAPALPVGVERVTLADIAYYRFTLPVPVGAGAHNGTWNALISIDDDQFKRHLSILRDRHPEAVQPTTAHGVPYNLSVHALSDLQMTARLLQSSNEPGARLDLQSTLTEAEVPFAGTADVSVELTSSGGTISTVPLPATAPGVYEASTLAPLPGVYLARFLATGTTRLGSPFSRDLLRTGLVWRGGDLTPPSSITDPSGRDNDLCRLIGCLEQNEGVRRLLEERGIKPDEAFRCLEEFCVARTRPRPEQGV
jgi:Common central domain of tyrosinase/von Willebrand factor type A domain